MAQPSTFAATPRIFHLQGKSLSTHLSHDILRSDRTGPPTTLLHKQTLSGPQTFRRRTSHHRSLHPQHLHHVRNLQDARHCEGQSIHPQRRKILIHRPLRSFLSCSYSPKVPEVPGLLPRRQALLFHCNAIRHKIRPPHLHQASHGGPQTLPQEPHPLFSVPRRLDPLEHIHHPTSEEHRLRGNPITQIGLHRKLGQIDADPPGLHHIPGGDLVRPVLHSPPQPEEHPEGLPSSTRSPTDSHIYKEKIPKVSRDNKLYSSLHSGGQVSPSSSDPDSSILLSPQKPHTPPGLPRPSPLVDKGIQSHQTGSYLSTTIPTDSLDRRIKFWVGGRLLPRRGSEGVVDVGRVKTPHQPAGNQSSHQLSSCPQSSQRTTHPPSLRQHDSGFTNHKTRFQQEPSTKSGTPETLLSMPPEQLDPLGETHTRTSQHMGRLTITKSRHQIGMDSEQDILPSTSQSDATRDRLICPSRERTTSPVRVCVPPSVSNHNGLLNSRLEPMELPIHISSNRPHPNMFPQIRRLRGPRNTRRTLSPGRHLVAKAIKHLQTISRRTRNLPACPRRPPLATPRDVLNLSRIQLLTKLLSELYHPSLADPLIKSLRKSTNAQYESCWKTFQSWLSSQDSQLVSKQSILLYLLYLSQVKHLNPKTILVHRNALHLPLLYGFNISTTDKEFSMLARSQFIENPPKQRFIPQWDPHKVLNLLKTRRFDIATCSKEDLFSKTLFLVALATGNRVSELSAMSRVALTFSQDMSQVVIPIRPGFLYKNQTMQRTPPNILIDALGTDKGKRHSLCPVRALRKWLQVTEHEGSESVFINPRSKKPLNRGSISLALVRLINSAIPNSFAKAHDIRKISASLAWIRGVSPQDITKFMFWTSSSTFISKYLVPVRGAQLGRSAQHQSSSLRH